MSKILDLLNHGKKEQPDRKGEEENFSNHIRPVNFRPDVKEKLANTYIFKPISKDKDTDENPDKKILPHQQDIATSNIRFAQLFPWLIAFLAVLLLLVNIVYRGKIKIDIEIVNERAPELIPDVSKNIPFKNDLIGEPISSDANITQISTALLTEGRLNSSIVKKIGFYGASLSESRMTRDGLYLVNDGRAGWASVGLDLTVPLDLSSSTLDFFIKGLQGNESLKLFVRDADYNSYMPQAYNIIFTRDMPKDWQFVSVHFDNFNGVYNPQKINHIGFEFGTQTTSNNPGAVIFVKNMKIVKNRAALHKGD